MPGRSAVIYKRSQAPRIDSQQFLAKSRAIRTTENRGVLATKMDTDSVDQPSPIIGLTAPDARTFRSVLFNLLSNPAIQVNPKALRLTAFEGKFGPQLDAIAAHQPKDATDILDLTQVEGWSEAHNLSGDKIGFHLVSGGLIPQSPIDLSFARAWAMFNFTQSITSAQARIEESDKFFAQIVREIDAFDKLNENPLLDESGLPRCADSELLRREDFHLRCFHNAGIVTIKVSRGDLTDPYFAVAARDTYTFYKLLSRGLVNSYYDGEIGRFNGAFARFFDGIAAQEHDPNFSLASIPDFQCSVPLGSNGIDVGIRTLPLGLGRYQDEISFAKVWFTFETGGRNTSGRQLAQSVVDDISIQMHIHASQLDRG